MADRKPRYDFPPVSNDPEDAKFTMSQVKKGIKAFGIKRKAKKETRKHIKNMAHIEGEKAYKRNLAGGQEAAMVSAIDAERKTKKDLNKQIPRRYR